MAPSTWTYTHTFDTAMNPDDMVTSDSGDVQPTYTWSDGNTKLTILVTFTAPAQEMTKIRVDVKEAVQ